MGGGPKGGRKDEITATLRTCERELLALLGRTSLAQLAAVEAQLTSAKETVAYERSRRREQDARKAALEQASLRDRARVRARARATKPEGSERARGRGARGARGRSAHLEQVGELPRRQAAPELRVGLHALLEQARLGREERGGQPGKQHAGASAIACPRSRRSCGA